MHLLVFNNIGQGLDRSGLWLANFLEGSGLGEIRKYPPEGGGPFAETASPSIYRLHAKRQSQFSENPLFLITKMLHKGRTRPILHAFPGNPPGSGLISSLTRSITDRNSSGSRRIYARGVRARALPVLLPLAGSGHR